jgi:hypothetical protein
MLITNINRIAAFNRISLKNMINLRTFFVPDRLESDFRYSLLLVVSIPNKIPKKKNNKRDIPIKFINGELMAKSSFPILGKSISNINDILTFETSKSKVESLYKMPK